MSTSTVRSLFPPSEEERLAASFKTAAQAILENQGPVMMEVPGLSTTDIEAVIEGLQRFDRLPREEQKLWEIHVPRDPKYDEPDDGAIRKSDSDWKLFFHYRYNLEILLRSKRDIILAPWQKEWFQRMDHILRICDLAFFEHAKELDRLSPGYDFELRAGLSESLNCLRTLRYIPRNGTLAKWHTDRDAITFHIAESAPGLKSGRGQKTREEQSPQAPNVLVFAGDQLAEITCDAVSRCWHTVEDTTEGKEERFAMVFFGKMYTDEL